MLTKDSIVTQLKKIETEVQKKNFLVAIGHDRTLTIEVLKEYVPKMQENGIEFVALSELIDAKE